jgi:hypothetical protein
LPKIKRVVRMIQEMIQELIPNPKFNKKIVHIF